MWKFLILKMCISLYIYIFVSQTRTLISTWVFPAFVFAIFFCIATQRANVFSGKWSLVLTLARFWTCFYSVFQLNSCPKDVLPFNWIALPGTLALYYTSWEGGLLAVVTVPSVLKASWNHEVFSKHWTMSVLFWSLREKKQLPSSLMFHCLAWEQIWRVGVSAAVQKKN